MGSDDQGERIRALEVKVEHLRRDVDKQAAREWAIFMACFGVLLTVLAQNLGWFSR